MRTPAILFLLLALAGCDDRAVVTSTVPVVVPSAADVAAETPDEPEAKPLPIVDGEVVVRIQEVATSPWLQAVVTYTNVAKKPVFVFGFGPDNPVENLETRDAAGSWVIDRTPLICGLGLHDMEIAPGESHTFRASIGHGDNLKGVEFRISLAYSMSHPLPRDVAGPHEPWVRAVSGPYPLKVGGSPAQP
jgi:hypothetical protein